MKDRVPVTPDGREMRRGEEGWYDPQCPHCDRGLSGYGSEMEFCSECWLDGVNVTSDDPGRE